MDTAKLKLLGTYIKGNLKENVQVRSLSPKLSMLHYQIFKRSNEPSLDKEYLL